MVNPIQPHVLIALQAILGQTWSVESPRSLSQPNVWAGTILWGYKIHKGTNTPSKLAMGSINVWIFFLNEFLVTGVFSSEITIFILFGYDNYWVNFEKNDGLALGHQHQQLFLGIERWIIYIYIYSQSWTPHDDVIKWKHFRVAGHLCEEFTGPRWIPDTKASDAEL